MSWSSAAIFYDQLRSLVAMGMPLPQALGLAGNTSHGRHRALAATWAAGCSSGRTLAELLAADAEPALAVALVRAGEASGRLPELCRELAGYYEHALAMRRLVIGRLVYPAFLVHVALVAAAIPGIAFSGASPLSLLAGPAVLWAALAVALAAFHLIGPRTRARLMLAPGLDGLVGPLVAANTCLVVRAGLAAGMLIPASLELAAPACGNRIYAERLQAAAGAVNDGRLANLTAALGAAGLPGLVVQMIGTAEIAGKLEEALQRCATFQQEAFRTRVEWTARVLSGTIYALAMAAAAFTVVSLYGSYLGQVKTLAEGVDG